MALVSVLFVLTAFTAQGAGESASAGAGSTQESAQTKKTGNSTSTASQSGEPAKTASAAADKKAEASAAKPSKTKKKAAAASAKRAKANGGAEVRVRTQEEMKKGRSEFLRPPGSSPDDRYGEDDDWYELPPWRKTTFFGLRARGQFFVYVVDCSGSMLDDDRLTRATIELRKSVMALAEPQKFEVIFYNNESIPMPGGPRPRTADLQNKTQLLSWLRLIEPDGGTEPRPAIKQGISLKPDAIFLLSDGEFPEGTVAEVAKLNTRKIPIHCVDLAGGMAGDHLKKIAEASGGQYASRSGSLHASPPSRIDRRP